MNKELKEHLKFKGTGKLFWVMIGCYCGPILLFALMCLSISDLDKVGKTSVFFGILACMVFCFLMAYILSFWINPAKWAERDAARLISSIKTQAILESVKDRRP